MAQSTSNANQILNVGDYVKTSKGKIGLVTKSACIEVGYHKSSDGQNWVRLESFFPDQLAEAMESRERRQWSYPNNYINTVMCKTEVKLGDKSYPIDDKQLTKLNELRIRSQQGFSQHELVLPIEDAKLLMDIYSRNNIWHALI